MEPIYKFLSRSTLVLLGLYSVQFVIASGTLVTNLDGENQRELFQRYLHKLEELVPQAEEKSIATKWSDWNGVEKYFNIIPILASELGEDETTEFKASIEKFEEKIPAKQIARVGEKLTSVVKSSITTFVRKEIHLEPYLDILDSFTKIEEEVPALFDVTTYEDCLSDAVKKYDGKILNNIVSVSSGLLDGLMKDEDKKYQSEGPDENSFIAFDRAYQTYFVSTRLEEEKIMKDFRADTAQCRSSLMSISNSNETEPKD